MAIKKLNKPPPPRKRIKKRAVTNIPVEGGEDAPPGLKTAEERAVIQGRIESLIEVIVENKRTVDALNDQIKVDRDALMAAMSSIGAEKSSAPMGRATVVRSSQWVLDQTKLKRKLGAALWNKVTVRALDRGKLDAFVASGEIEADDVALCGEEQERTPYIKVTPK